MNKLTVTPTNRSEFCEAMAYALWAYLHRCCKRLGHAKVIGTGELKPGFIGRSEVSATPKALESSLWQVYARDSSGRRASCFVTVQVGDREPDIELMSAASSLSLWPGDALYLKVFWAKEIHWKTPESALAFLDGDQFPEPL